MQYDKKILFCLCTTPLPCSSQPKDTHILPYVLYPYNKYDSTNIYKYWPQHCVKVGPHVNKASYM